MSKSKEKKEKDSSSTDEEELWGLYNEVIKAATYKLFRNKKKTIKQELRKRIRKIKAMKIVCLK